MAVAPPELVMLLSLHLIEINSKLYMQGHRLAHITKAIKAKLFLCRHEDVLRSNLGIIWRRVVSFTFRGRTPPPPQYPLHWTLSGSWSRAGSYGEESKGLQ
jgi:hypothetical protein